MSAFVRKYPAISLLILAMIFGTAPSLAVATGLLPPAASQLGALSSIQESTAEEKKGWSGFVHKRPDRPKLNERISLVHIDGE